MPAASSRRRPMRSRSTSAPCAPARSRAGSRSSGPGSDVIATAARGLSSAGARWWRRSVVALAVLAAAGGAALRLAPKAPLESHATFSTAVYARDGELLRLTLARDEQYRLWVPLA